MSQQEREKIIEKAAALRREADKLIKSLNQTTPQTVQQGPWLQEGY